MSSASVPDFVASPAMAHPLEDLNMPLYERVRLSILARLAAHHWSPSDPIPTEQALSAEYGVSIGTVRKAVERLVKDGLLVKVQGKGTYVKRPEFQNSLSRFFRYRDAAGRQVLPLGVVKAVERVPAIPDINERLRLQADQSLIYLRRERRVDHTVVLSEHIWLPESLFGKLGSIPPEHFGNLLYPFYDEVCGQFVSGAVETLSFVSDRHEDSLHARTGDLLVRIERVAHNLQGHPIEYRVSYGRPQNFRYEVRIG